MLYVRRIAHIIILLCFTISACNTSASGGEALPSKMSASLKPVRDILVLPEEKIDLAAAKLQIDKILDASIDIEANLHEIERIVAGIKKVPRYNETVEGRLNGIIQFLYTPGDWNKHAPFRYDFTDPRGTVKPENALLSNYLRTRRGNCVSMPTLVLIAGERLGLDVSLALAPLHLFVRLNDDGHHYNFEATAGGLKADSSYVEELLISPEALKNGVYLRSLTKKEAVAAMLTDTAHYYSGRSRQSSDFDMAFALTELILKYDGTNVGAMIVRGNTWRNILYRDLDMLKAKRLPVEPRAKKHFDELLSRNLLWYKRAEKLGWREPPPDYEQRYLDMVNKMRHEYE